MPAPCIRHFKPGARSATAVALLLAAMAGPATAHRDHAPDTAQTELPAAKPAEQALAPSETAELDTLEARFRLQPDDAATVAAYVRALAALARKYAKTGFIETAQAALAPWDSADRPPADLLIARAHIRQIDHAFTDALADLDRALAIGPDAPQALLSRAFVLATIGRPDEALPSCEALAGVRDIVRQTCRARMLGLTGRAAMALDLLDQALRSATHRTGDTPFALSVAAEIADRLQQTARADRYYRQRLQLAPASVSAKTAYAAFLIEQRRKGDARDLLQGAPDTDHVLLLRVVASDSDNDAVARSAADQLKRRLREDVAADEYSHAREQSRFALAHLGDTMLALDLARRNWDRQREPVDARLLVEAAIAAGDMRSVQDVAAWRARLGLEDPRLSRRIEEAARGL